VVHSQPLGLLHRTLSRSEAAFLLTVPRSDHRSQDDSEAIFRTIIRLPVATGMRVGELCKLSLADLSPDCTSVRIQGKGARDRIAYITDAALRQDLLRIVENS
jgi:site-specific recombinase XerD